MNVPFYTRTMFLKVSLTFFVSVFLFYIMDVTTDVADIRVSNLNDSCLRCLCYVAGCDLSHGCTGGYCGPFYISRVYWVDAGKPTLPEDNSERKEAYEDCARDYYCSQKIVERYMAIFGQDCNKDGVTDCFDFMMINHNGGQSCSDPLYMSDVGRRRLQLFQQCRLQ